MQFHTTFTSSVALAIYLLVSTQLRNAIAQTVSPNGNCGSNGNFTCTGSAVSTFGECCSSSGYCGNSTAHCGGGCQAAYGVCKGNETPNGACGGANGYTCTAEFGGCCSDHGYCGSTLTYCGSGCQTAYSLSGEKGCSTASLLPSVDGSCGGNTKFTCAGGAFDGMCCSSYGYCGTTEAHCSTIGGCQANFGKCTSP